MDTNTDYNKKIKCNYDKCNKSLGLTDSLLPCLCKFVFCTKHRPSTEHKCTFDYKQHWQDIRDEESKKKRTGKFHERGNGCPA